MLKYEPMGQSGYRDRKREQKIAHLKRSVPVLNILLRLMVIGVLILAVGKGCAWWAEQSGNCRSFERMY